MVTVTNSAFTALTLALMCVDAASGAEFDHLSIGARSGFSARARPYSFYQTEVVANWELPLKLHSDSLWLLTPRLETTAGWLYHHHQTAFIGTLGPTATLKYRDFPVTFDAGVRAVVLSQDRFEETDFGIPFQFISHVGLEWEVTNHWSLGYRFQHMSNSGLGSSNPGLNTHMFGIGYRF